MAIVPVRWIVTGGIGSGKSTAAGILAGFGLRVVDADRVAHEAYEPGGRAFSAVANEWPGVIVDGRVDRAALGRIVFADRSELRKLESFVHPAVRARLAEIVDESGVADLVVELSVPLNLLGPGFTVVVVDAPDELRVRRLEARGLCREEISRRMLLQPSREEWLALADLVVDNSGAVGDLIRRLEEALDAARSRGRSQPGAPTAGRVHRSRGAS